MGGVFIENLLLPDESWRCILAFENDILVGILPVVIARNTILGFSRSRIRTPHNKHSFSVDFLAARGREQVILPYLLSSLMTAQPDAYEFCLNRLPDNSPTLSILKNGCANTITVSEFDGYGSYLKIEGSLEDYRKSLSKNFLRNLVKARNKLARLAEVKTIILTGPEASEADIGRFLNVEGSGWKGKAGTAIQLSPTLVSYYTALTTRLGRLGRLEWHFLTAGERTIAGQLGIRMGRTLLILKIGYDEEFAFCAPGNMLFDKIVERAFHEGDTDEINCITDMPWHDNWGMSKRPHYNLWIYPRQPLPWILGAMRLRVKIGLRRLPGVQSMYRRLRILINKK